MQGVLFGLGAAAGQAVGFVLSKQSLAGDFPPLAGNSIRMLAAVTLLWAIASFQGKARETLASMRARPTVLGWLAMAAFTGPVLGTLVTIAGVAVLFLMEGSLVKLPLSRPPAARGATLRHLHLCWANGLEKRLGCRLPGKEMVRRCFMPHN